MNITVLMGGTSSERDVSLSSGLRIAEALRERGHRVTAVDPARGAISEEEEAALRSAGVVKTVPPSPEELRELERESRLPLLGTFPEVRSADVVFLALHGGQGEDGTVQALLDMIGVRYTGSGHLASALAMDKDLSKRLFRMAGVPTADWLMTGSSGVLTWPAGPADPARSVSPTDPGSLTPPGDLTQPDSLTPPGDPAQRVSLTSSRDLTQSGGLTPPGGLTHPRGLTASGGPSGSAEEVVERALGWPVVVKPSKEGSTVGLTLVREPAGLAAAVEEAARHDDEVMIERFIPGRELTVAVVGDQALPVGEIFPKHEIYDYECKYTAGMAYEKFPADLTDACAAEAQQLALAAFRALKLRGCARIDFRMTDSGELYCLEANTLPGMTPLSLVPQAAAAAGMSFAELCDRIVQLAL